MANKVDLSQLAVHRQPDQPESAGARKNWLTRYLLPALFGFGFLSLLVWAGWDIVFPPRVVTVVPVVAMQSQGRQEGAPLFKAAGWVEPRPTPVRVPALAPGVVEKLLVVEDQAVKAGEPIAELVKADAQLAHDRSCSDERLSEAELAAARAALEATKARLEFARRDLQRKQLVADAVAGRTIDESKANHAAAQAALDEAEAKIKAAVARLQQVRVQVAEAKLRLDRMTVRAPHDGRVYQLIAYPGATLPQRGEPMKTSDDNTVVTLYQPGRLQVRTDVRFDDLPRVSLQQQVALQNPALAAPIKGHVLFVGSAANIQKNTLEVKVGIDEPAPMLKPEMLMDVTFLANKPLDEKSAATSELRLFVPRELIQRDDGGAYVWMADQAAGVVRRKGVETGTAGSGELVEITKGLDMSSRLVARGGEGLANGVRIRVGGEEPAATSHSMSGQHHQPLQRLPQGEK